MRPAFLFPILPGILAASVPVSATAPQVQMVQKLNPDADELAAQMRLLAADPRDINALVRAGELALKLGDPTAAGVLFSRAEKVDPQNARVKAGAGSLLVRAERPGEALRRFAEAEALGLDPRAFAADRGLAYDLVGEQARAQRDYRLALQAGADSETVRRYALSLGISGKRDQALEQLDPLVRQNDRGAWRARAFILAMTGDDAGAEAIATRMMPGGLAAGLQPFFERLSSLAPADRAFAVHFGEVRATPERIADARLVPALAPLAPEPGVATMIAGQTPPPRAECKKDRKEDRKSRREKRNRDEPVQRVAATQPVDAPAEPPPAAARPAPAPVLAAGAPLVRPAASPSGSATGNRNDRVIASTNVAPPAAAPPKASPITRDGQGTGPAIAEGKVETESAKVETASAKIETPSARSEIPSARVAAAAPVVTSAPVRSEDSILAAIIANISIPGSELGIEPVTPPPDRAPAPVQETPAPDPAEAAAEKRAAEARQALVDKKAADAKLAAEKKTADAKKAADKKAAELKKKNDPKLLEPSRIWVQVAGGANEATLAREWARIVAKAPAAFKGKQGWSTKLRATNRILTGPFKTDGEARAFVNLLAKEDVAAFPFTSEAGQKVSQLPR